MSEWTSRWVNGSIVTKSQPTILWFGIREPNASAWYTDVLRCPQCLEIRFEDTGVSELAFLGE